MNSSLPGEGMSQAHRAERATNVQSVQRAVALLRAIADSQSGVTAADLAHLCGLNRATVWRVIKTLQDEGMVTMLHPSGRYVIGPTAIEIGSAGGRDGLLALARPLLERACRLSGETASLAVLESAGLTYIDEVTPSRVIAASWVGRTVPLHATSTGKVLLAWSEPDEVDQVLDGELAEFTPTTVVRSDELRAELEQIRRQGYACCRGEYEQSLFGVSAPVLDSRGRLVVVVSLWGPRVRFGDDRWSELGDLIIDTAARLQQARSPWVGRPRTA